MIFCFCYGYGDHRDLHVATHSFPTRRSADLSAAIGAEDAGQPGLDTQFGGFDEAFETGEAQPLYLHGMVPCRSSNRSWCNLGVTYPPCSRHAARSEETTSELQSLIRNSYAVFCLIKKTDTT